MEMLVIEDICVGCTPTGMVSKRQCAQGIAMKRQLTGNKILPSRLSNLDEILWKPYIRKDDSSRISPTCLESLITPSIASEPIIEC